MPILGGGAGERGLIVSIDGERVGAAGQERFYDVDEAGLGGDMQGCVLAGVRNRDICPTVDEEQRNVLVAAGGGRMERGVVERVA